MKPGETIESLLRWKWYDFGVARGLEDEGCCYCGETIPNNSPFWTNDNHEDYHIETNLWLHKECARLLGVLW